MLVGTLAITVDKGHQAFANVYRVLVNFNAYVQIMSISKNFLSRVQ